MERAQRTTRNHHGTHGGPRRRSNTIHHTLPEVSRCLLGMIPGMVEASLREEGRPLFFVHHLIADSNGILRKRRIYQVLHVWEGIGIICRVPGQGAYHWLGEEGYNAFKARVDAADTSKPHVDFVDSELSRKGWAHAQRLTTAIFYLFQHPAKVQMPPIWSRDDFWVLAQEAAEDMDVSSLERLYYDVLNIFVSLSIATVRLVKTTRMAWTPGAFCCVPRADSVDPVDSVEGPLPHEIAHVAGTAIVVIERTAVVPSPRPSIIRALLPDAPQVSRAVKRLATKKGTRPVEVKRAIQLAREAELKQETRFKATPIRKRAIPPERMETAHLTTTMRTRSQKNAREDLSTTFDLSASSYPPPPLPLSVVVPDADAFAKSNSMSSTRSLTEDPASPDHFSCDLKAWNAFSDWANGENTLPALFGGDLLLQVSGH